MKSTVSRRALMKTFAGLGAAAPLFKGLLRDAFAQALPTYPRFVVLSNPNGCAPDFWRPRAVGGGAAATTGWTLDFDPDSSLGPLEAHKDSLVIIEGLDLTCNFDMGGYLGHNGGCVAQLTGRHARTPENTDSMRTTGPSIDFFLAKLLKVEPFLFSPVGYSGNAGHITFDDAGERVANEYELPSSWKKWFGTFTGPSAMPDPKAAARKKAELAALSYLNGEAKLLRGRLAGAERLKLDGQIDGLNLIQQKLSGAGLPPTASCQKPAQPPRPGDGQESIKLMLQFATQLLACNLTRVVTLGIDPVNSGKMPWLPGPLATLAVHNDIAHGYRPDDPISGRNLSKVQRWYAQQVADFIAMLKAIPEGNGTVYDNTIILWSNELGDPARHMNNNIPFVLAGGGGSFKRGRYLKLSTAPEYKESPDAHTRLLTSLVNQYGANLPVFGDPRYPGELPGFLM
ncbi:MAG TPA: DUF1552 domain-containing protein [Polyangia bacterium]|jgi:hypothetical protein|nr:DUF1552 domain-containing protein [Polyangia bacterium]